MKATRRSTHVVWQLKLYRDRENASEAMARLPTGMEKNFKPTPVWVSFEEPEER